MLVQKCCLTAARRSAALAAIVLTSQVFSPHAFAQPAPKPAPIDRNGVMILIRSTLLALDAANKTGNYTVLRDMGAPAFHANSDARLAEIFASQRRDKLDLSGVAVLDPQLSLLPQIEANGVMHMTGFFPSVPSQVNFDLAFAPIEGQWKIYGLSVAIGSSSPTAPGGAPAAAPAPAQAAPPEAAAKPASKRSLTAPGGKP